jgi:predicted translin family RNA/ssDNA-binding protein
MNATEYKHKLAGRLLDITNDIRLLDKTVILQMHVGDIERLGKTVKEASELLEVIQQKNMVVAKMMDNKRSRLR